MRAPHTFVYWNRWFSFRSQSRKVRWYKSLKVKFGQIVDMASSEKWAREKWRQVWEQSESSCITPEWLTGGIWVIMHYKIEDKRGLASKKLDIRAIEIRIIATGNSIQSVTRNSQRRNILRDFAANSSFRGLRSWTKYVHPTMWKGRQK